MVVEHGPCVCIQTTIISLVLQIFPYLEAFECNTISDWLHRNLQIFEKKTKNVRESGR